MVYLQRYDGLIDQYFGSAAIEGKLELGELYRTMDRLDESNAYKLEAIRRARTGGSRVERITTLYYYLDDNAEHMLEPGFSEYLDEYLDLIGEQHTDGTVDYSHAGLLLVRFEGDDKLAFLESGVDALEKIEHSKALMFLVHELVTEYRANRRYADAHMTALKGMRIARERNEIPYILVFQQDLYAIAEQQGRFDSAFKYLLNYHDLKDSLSSTTVMAKVDSLKIQFETVKKEQQITDQRLQIQQRTNQRNLLIASIAVLVCFAAFGILFLWNRNRTTKKLARQESHIQEQRIQQLEQEKQLVAMNSVLEGQETERVRIASDLHDGLGGLLGTIKARFSSMQNGARSPEQQLVYAQVDTLINTASQEVRRISHNMAPHALRLSGLHDALGDLAKQINTPDLDVEFQWFGVEDRMEESTEIMLYRIIQELTNNVMKYAQAKSLHIQVNRFNDQLSLIVEDDGRGFDLEAVQRKDGLGLRSVRSRVEFLKGTMDIDTRPGDGTLVSVRIPL